MIAVILGFALYSVGAPTPGLTADGPPEPRSSLPEGCELAEVRDLFDGFFAAVNAGDEASALRYIAPEPELNGFGVGIEASRRWLLRSRNPERVYGHFAAAAQRGQRLAMLGGAVSAANPGALLSGPFRRPEAGPTADDPVVAVSFQFRLTQPGHPVMQPSGKGGIDCATGQFYIWVMRIGPPPEPEPGVRGARPCGNKGRLDAADPPPNPVLCHLTG
jgi:hypothetical protein